MIKSDFRLEDILRRFLIKLKKEIELEGGINTCGSRTWTKIVKKSFCELGKNLGFKPYASEYEGEYLLDVLWESKTKEIGPILGVESEWGSVKDVEEDFYKLMYVKCKFKVLIYGSTSEKKGREFQSSFKEWLTTFDKNLHLKGEKYLFIDITDYEPYRVVAYSFVITQDCIIKRDSIKLTKLKEIRWDSKKKRYCF